MTRFVLVVACVCGAAAASAQTELLPNPGFEDLNNDGNVGDGWGSFGAAGLNEFFGGGNGHASLFTDNNGNSGGVFHTGIPGSPGVLYEFTLLDTFIEGNSMTDFQFGLEFFQADDSTQISAEVETVEVPENLGGGLVFSTTAVAPAGTVFVRPIMLFGPVTAPSSGGANTFVFEASLVAIPEPATATLVGLTLAGVALRRRR